MFPDACRVRSEDIGTDAELGSAKISVLQAMGISPDQAAVKHAHDSVGNSIARRHSSHLARRSQDFNYHRALPAYVPVVEEVVPALAHVM